ncbi:hypothetical protein JCM8202v2_005223 [Rhodotorula sphaerocarpa]
MLRSVLALLPLFALVSGQVPLLPATAPPCVLGCFQIKVAEASSLAPGVDPSNLAGFKLSIWRHDEPNDRVADVDHGGLFHDNLRALRLDRDRRYRRRDLVHRKQRYTSYKRCIISHGDK